MNTIGVNPGELFKILLLIPCCLFVTLLCSRYIPGGTMYNLVHQKRRAQIMAACRSHYTRKRRLG